MEGGGVRLNNKREVDGSQAHTHTHTEKKNKESPDN
jgi:hypothetical protein